MRPRDHPDKTPAARVCKGPTAAHRPGADNSKLCEYAFTRCG
jgi:hypothetical protein